MIRFVIILVMSLVLFSLQPAAAQDSQNTGNVISLTRTDRFPGAYMVECGRISSIRCRLSEPVLAEKPTYTLGGNIGRGLFTVITGIGTDVTNAVIWHIISEICTNDSNLNWHLHLYGPGTLTKETSKVTNENGSKSVETTYKREIFWDSAVGFIVEKCDTIGAMYISINPRNNSNLVKWTKTVYKEGVPHSKSNFKVKQTAEFSFWGELRDLEFAILFNSDENKIYIFNDQGLTGIYIYDKLQTFVKKKKRVQPYLQMFTGSNQGRMDCLRLAMTGQAFKDFLDPPFLLQ